MIGGTAKGVTWTNPSVRRFAPTGDPIEKMISASRDLVLRAQEQGWSGPPFDPIELAGLLNIHVQPSSEVLDARLSTVPGGGFLVEFNPGRPRARVRYSIAHEIGHTILPDAAEQTRHRMSTSDMRADDWQLELLCNVAAAELLLPVGSVGPICEADLGIDALMAARSRFEVSAEAMLLRAIRLTSTPCAMFAASSTAMQKPYRVDYFVGSRTWNHGALNRVILPVKSVINECTAIGYTAKGRERWPGLAWPVAIECAGIAPFPHQQMPRVVGVLKPVGGEAKPLCQLREVRGDATEPRGQGAKVLVHVVNDKTPNWGGGFARVVRDRWPIAQDDFRVWVQEDWRQLSLGSIRVCQVDHGLELISMVAQHGYGPSATPRIRYAALRDCLKQVAELVKRRGTQSVHMPLIGCGEAGGSWPIVRELVDECLCQSGVEVYVYVLPGKPLPTSVHPESLFSMGA